MTTTPQNIVISLAANTKAASEAVSQTSEQQINAILRTLAQALRDSVPAILEANALDITAGEERGLAPAMLDRLLLNAERIEGMARGVEVVADLPDPVGHVLKETDRPNGLKIQKVSVPIGVLGMIYESRPNVTIDAAALCLKSRNAVMLRGGSESLQSSLALHGIIQDVLAAHDLPKAAVSMIPTADRAAVGAMLAADAYIDVMIPRGGKGLISRVMDEARMPVFSHLDGLCHIYVHSSATPSLVRDVILNAKMRRTGICGAVETILFDQDLAQETARDIVTALLDAGCAVVGDDRVQALDSRVGAALDEDWVTEYLDAKVSIRTVGDVDAAIAHINHYGSHHTDSILAEDLEAVRIFQAQVDSGIVMHNTSTQFADGGEFGMGAEIGIATGKMHARGPVGLEQLCTYKYLVHGSGQVRP